MVELSSSAVAGTIIVAAGFIILTVGIFINAWTGSIGLFRYCYYIYCENIDLSAQEPYFKAVVAMEILAFLTSLICLFGKGIFILCRVLQKWNQIFDYIPKVVFIASFTTDVFAGIGCIIYAVKVYGRVGEPDIGSYSVNVNYAFFLTIIGAIVITVGSFIFRNGAKVLQIGGM